MGERRRPPPSLASMAAEDLVDMSTDDLKERYNRTVTMAGKMARGGAAADGRVDNDQKKGVGVAAAMLCSVRSLFVPPDAPLQLLPVDLRVRRVILVPKVVLPDVPLGAKSLFRVIPLHMAVDFRDAGSTTQLRPPAPLNAPPLGYPHLPCPFSHHHHHHQHHHHHHHHPHHPYQLHDHPQEPLSDPEPDPYVKMEEE